MRCGIPVADLFTGSYATISILAALHQRNKTGIGQHIDMALFDTMVSLMSVQNMNALVGSVVPQRTGIRNQNVVPYQIFQAKDRPFVLAVGNDSQYEKLKNILKIDKLSSDQFKTNFLWDLLS